MGILTRYLYIVIIVLSCGELFRLQLGNGISINLLDVLVGIFFLWGLLFILSGRHFQNISYGNYLLVFIGIASLSLFLNSSRFSLEQLGISALYLLRFIAYASVGWIVFLFSKKQKKEIVTVLLFTGLLIVFFGYIQYFFYQNLRNLFYLGWDDHLYRMFSTFFDPNYLGAVFVLIILLFFYRIFNYQDKSEQKKKMRDILGMSVTAIALLLTYSRSSFVMAIVSIGLFLWISGKRSYVVVLIGIFFVSMSILSPFFYIENINIFRSVSTEGRLETMGNAIRIFADHPFFGVGFNTYRYTQIEYGLRTVQGGLESHADAGVDNSFLFVLATTGLAGLLAYGMMIWNIMKNRFTIMKKTENREEYLRAGLCMVSLIGICVHALFMNSLFYPHLMLWMGILIGITERK